MGRLLGEICVEQYKLDRLRLADALSSSGRRCSVRESSRRARARPTKWRRNGRFGSLGGASRS